MKKQFLMIAALVGLTVPAFAVTMTDEEYMDWSYVNGATKSAVANEQNNSTLNRAKESTVTTKTEQVSPASKINFDDDTDQVYITEGVIPVPKMNAAVRTQYAVNNINQTASFGYQQAAQQQIAQTSLPISQGQVMANLQGAPVRVEYPVQVRYPVQTSYPVYVQPRVTVQQPVVMTQPMTVQQPIVVTQPVTMQHQPMYINRQPMMVQQQPIYMTNQPMTIQGTGFYGLNGMAMGGFMSGCNTCY